MGCNELVLPQDFATSIGDGDPFERVMQLQGEVFRNVPGRRTLRFDLAGKSYFAKLHFGVGWREIFKNLLTFRLPTVSASTEWRAIRRLGELGIATTPAVAYGCRGASPATLRSFIITEDLGDIVSLEDFCRDWATKPPPLQLKRKLIVAVADLAHKLHGGGLTHRDFYLCHFCLDAQRLQAGEIFLYLIDLHRAQPRTFMLLRWRNKDLAALYFSTLDIGLGRRDKLRFLKSYFRKPLREILRDEGGLLTWLEARARRLQKRYWRKYT